MALSTTKITISEVQEALNVSYTDLSDLCRSDEINPFSKKKPIVLPNTSPDRNSSWWKGATGNCGLTPYLIINYTKIPDAYELNDNNMNGWIYSKPTGGTSAPYRLADFAGYDHNANPPLRNFGAPNQVALNGSGFSCSCMIQVSGGTSLSFSDFSSGLQNYYFGAYIVKGSYKQIATSSTTLANNASTVDFGMQGFATGTWTAYPFLSQNKIIQNSGMTANTFYSVPILKPATINIISTLIIVNITAEATPSLGSISYKVTINNLDSTSRTLTNNVLRLRYADKDFLDPLIVGEQSKSLGSVTVQRGLTTVAEGFFTNVDSDLMKNPKVWASFQSSTYLQSVIPMTSVAP